MKLATNVFPPDHADVCSSFETLVEVVVSQNDFADAEALCKKVIALRSLKLGARHVEVAYAMARLGHVYQLQNKHEKADNIYKQAVDVYTLSRGREGLELVNMLESYAITLRELGNRVSAVKMEARAKAIRETYLATV